MIISMHSHKQLILHMFQKRFNPNLILSSQFQHQQNLFLSQHLLRLNQSPTTPLIIIITERNNPHIHQSHPMQQMIQHMLSMTIDIHS